MKPKAYIETTVISYLTAWPNRDIVIAGHQQVTREWWQTCHERFDVVTSELVAQEASAGDPTAAQERLNKMAPLKRLHLTEEAIALAETLVAEGAVPVKVREDALHIALATTSGVDYLVTWNCRHLANAVMRAKIEEVCRSAGYEPVIICTPEELLEG